MKKIGILVLVIFVMIQCQNKSQHEEKINNQKSTVESQELFDHKSVKADAEAKLEISGMVCKMGCGGTIKKELYATESIQNVEIDFENERNSNFATIKYDSKNITPTKIKEVIETINDGQFKVNIQ